MKKFILFFILSGMVWAVLRVSAAQPSVISKTNRVNVINLLYENSKASIIGSRSLEKSIDATPAATLLLDTDNTLHEIQRHPGAKGTCYVRYRQYYHEIPFWSYQVIVASSHGATKVRGNVIETPPHFLGNLTPSLDSIAAIKQARSLALQTENVISESEFKFSNETAELVIYIDDALEGHLAYAVSFFMDSNPAGHPRRPYCIIDADTRRVLQSWEGLTHELVGTGPGGNEKTGIYEYGTDYGYLDVFVSNSICTMSNANVQTISLSQGSDTSTAFSFIGPRNTFKTVNGAYSPLNDAHSFGGVIWNMYCEWYHSAPLTFPLIMRVHYGTNYENAFWNGSSMTFGDGAAKFYPLVSLDIAAHEVSHGFTEQHSGLLYINQSGGINEAFSDMAGEAAEYYFKGSADFWVGAQIIKHGDLGLRYLSDPPRDGYSIDYAPNYYDGMDVHYSSGIFNKAFYLLATTPGWTVRKAFEVFLNANQNYWTPREIFLTAAFGVRDAAEDLGYSTTDVRNAFLPVGILLPESFINVTVPSSGNTNATGSYLIKWSAYDRTKGFISLYYDTDNTGEDGILIASYLQDSNYKGQFLWNVTSVPAGKYYIYAVYNFERKDWVDYSAGTVTIQMADAYEPDNTSSQATPLAIGATQSHHSIIPTNDVDWVSFQLTNVPAVVTIETDGAAGDTRLWLYDSSFLETLAYDDDSGNNLFSKIIFSFDKTGTYYLKINQNGINGIEDYQISIQSSVAQPSVTNSPTLTFTPFISATTTRTLTGSPTLSPILSATSTPTFTKTMTCSPTRTITRTATPSPTPRALQTATASVTPHNTRFLTFTSTPSLSSTATTIKTLSTLTSTPIQTPMPSSTAISNTATVLMTATRVTVDSSEQVLAYPQPARDKVYFLNTVKNAARMEITIFRISGECVASIREMIPPGQTSVLKTCWETHGIAPGIYCCQIVMKDSQGVTLLKTIKKVALSR